MTADPVVDHCPNCGAPLQLDGQGTCAWCHATVRVDAATPGDSEALLLDLPDPDGAIAKMVGHDQLQLPESSVFLPLPVFPLLSALDAFGYDPAVQRFLATPARLPAVQLVVNTVKTAGERLQDADVPEGEVLSHANKLYTPEEWWTIDLLVDLIAALGSLPRVDRDTRTSAQQTVRLHDELWHRTSKRPIRHAGEGPEALRDLRATVAHRDS